VFKKKQERGEPRFRSFSGQEVAKKEKDAPEDKEKKGDKCDIKPPETQAPMCRNEGKNNGQLLGRWDGGWDRQTRQKWGEVRKG